MVALSDRQFPVSSWKRESSRLLNFNEEPTHKYLAGHGQSTQAEMAASPALSSSLTQSL